MKQALKTHLEESARIKLGLIANLTQIETIIVALRQVISGGGGIYSCGNGGSACDAAHLAEELVARYKRERPGIKAQHFGDPGIITCWANDYDFESIYRRQVETLMNSKDALIVFSTSGNSENIVQALAAAEKLGAVTIALLGSGGGKAKASAKHALVVDSDITAHIQEAHITVVHMMCEQLEEMLYGQ